MTHRAFRGVGRTRIDLDITLRTLPPHCIYCTYLLMIENACLGISGSAQNMRVHARVHRQVFVHSSDRCRAIDRRRAVAG
jgi:hypothetical protein